LTTTHYGEHIDALLQIYEAALTEVNGQGPDIEAVLLHSGSEQSYFGDDRAVPFQAYGHYCHWLPVHRPDQFIYFRPGQRPIYYQIVPDDFWYDQSIDLAPWWSDQFEVIRLNSVIELSKQLPATSTAYLGADSILADKFGIASELINPPKLLAYLDFHRAYKTEYELDQLRAANQIALQGHAAARDKFLAGGNEYEIHMAFLTACGILEEESPYTNIVALDEKSAILHYQHKRREPANDSQVLLIDAGCRVNGYCSDITRTSVKQPVHAVFRSLLRGMEKLELDLIEQIRPAMVYQELHASALQTIAGLLLEHDIVGSGNTGTGASADELLQNEIPQLFMPHGVGHLLGVQVHDVGGHQQDTAGAILAPPSHSPALRNTRELATNMVFTIEPGLYFIPLLLDAERHTARGKLLNWSLVDELKCCGGIRIEDNVCVTAQGAENLTRQFE
jgi:Xaa-Pro dipeptidase